MYIQHRPGSDGCWLRRPTAARCCGEGEVRIYTVYTCITFVYELSIHVLHSYMNYLYMYYVRICTVYTCITPRRPAAARCCGREEGEAGGDSAPHVQTVNAQGPCRTCHESKVVEEEGCSIPRGSAAGRCRGTVYHIS